MSTACIEMATRLGKALADAPQSKALAEAHQKLSADPTARELVEAFQTQAVKVAQLEQSNQPISPDDKHKLQQLNDQLVACDVYKAFLDAQVQYADLMRRTNAAIRSELPQLE